MLIYYLTVLYSSLRNPLFVRRQTNLDKFRVSTFFCYSLISFLYIHCFPFLPGNWMPVVDWRSISYPHSLTMNIVKSSGMRF